MRVCHDLLHFVIAGETIDAAPPDLGRPIVADSQVEKSPVKIIIKHGNNISNQDYRIKATKKIVLYIVTHCTLPIW
jgi:hypothetical protein